MRNAILTLHIISSIVALIITLMIVIRALLGVFKKVELTVKDVRFPFFATLLLYLQLLLGSILYIFYILDYSNGEIDMLAEASTGSRFWAVEHFILMVFTLVIAHIGWIFARNGKTPQLIFKKNILYFGVVCTMIFISMTMNAIRHAL
ncbi:MAG: hypothetical protein JEZ14_06580 [Marinilabiliaceae bacterium]|nr:hypothetical protein [Marinilabiliaceae bacterium]